MTSDTKARPDHAEVVPTTPIMRVAPVLVVAALTLATVRTASAPLGDPDTLWHVLAGRDLWAHWDFSGPDPLATFTTENWVRNQWLGELVMATVADTWGLPGVSWLAAALQAALVVALYAACRRVAAPLPASLGTVAAVLGASGGLAARPQLAGLCLLAVSAGAWYATSVDLRPRWWLIPLTWVWSMTHGTWAVGVAVGAVTVVGLVADRRLQPAGVLRLAAIPLAAAVLPVATPLGWNAYGSLVQIAGIRPYVREWARPSLSLWQLDVVLAVAAVIVLCWAARRRRVQWVHVLLLALALAWALMYVRSIAIGAIITAPLFALTIGAALDRPKEAISPVETGGLIAGAVVTLALGALLAASAPSTDGTLSPALRSRLDSLPPGVVVLNSDDIGGALMWSYPQLRHTFDTRAELYGPERLRGYADLMRAQPGWERELDHYHPDVALLPTESPLAAVLIGQRGWSVWATDDDQQLLRSPTL